MEQTPREIILLSFSRPSAAPPAARQREPTGSSKFRAARLLVSIHTLPSPVHPRRWAPSARISSGTLSRYSDRWVVLAKPVGPIEKVFTFSYGRISSRCGMLRRETGTPGDELEESGSRERLLRQIHNQVLRSEGKLFFIERSHASSDPF
jgi:hypothetical protein